MRRLGSFLSDTRGLTTTGYAGVAVVLGLMGIATANMLDSVNRNGGLPQIAFIKPDGGLVVWGGGKPVAKSLQSGIDMTATGSIGRITLDPCTGKPK